MGELEQSMRGFQGGISLAAEQIPGMPVQDILLVRMLKLANEGLKGRFAGVLRPHRLNESEFRTLMQLFSSPTGSAFPSDLCSLVGQTPANMTRITDALVARKLISRAFNASDRRRIELRINSAGRKFVTELLPRQFAVIRASFADLSGKDKRLLQALLQRIIVSIDRIASE